jgi:hypothetical protein
VKIEMAEVRMKELTQLLLKTDLVCTRTDCC